MRLEGATGQDLILTRTHNESDWKFSTGTDSGERSTLSLIGDVSGKGYWKAYDDVRGNPVVQMDALLVSGLTIQDAGSIGFGGTYTGRFPTLEFTTDLKMSNVFSVSATGVGVHANVPVTMSGTLSATDITAETVTTDYLSLSGITDDTLTVGGKFVKLIQGTPTVPKNFRIYDTYPTDNKEETNSMVWLKWN